MTNPPPPQERYEAVVSPKIINGRRVHNGVIYDPYSCYGVWICLHDHDDETAAGDCARRRLADWQWS